MVVETTQSRVLRVLTEAIPGIDFENSDSLVDDKKLDSLMLAVIITVITMEFDIDIPFEDLTDSSNFNSLESITGLVEKYL